MSEQFFIAKIMPVWRTNGMIIQNRQQASRSFYIANKVSENAQTRK